MSGLWDKYPRPSELFKLYERSLEEFDEPERHFPLHRIYVKLSPATSERIFSLAICLAGGKPDVIGRQIGANADFLSTKKQAASLSLLELFLLLKLVSNKEQYVKVIRLVEDRRAVSESVELSKLLIRLALSIRPKDRILHGKTRREASLPLAEVKAYSSFVLPFLRNGLKDADNFNPAGQEIPAL